MIQSSLSFLAKNKLIISFLFFFVLLLFNDTSMAQCPMCKASAESSLKEGASFALGLNKGILYLLAMPYLLFTIIFFMWYKNYRRKVVVK